MSQAFYTAIGGISASQKKIDVIADNIANMNTVAFKESNVYFENVFSRTLSMGSGPSSSQGGTNPMQIGLGVQLSSIDRNFANGTTQSTGRVSDLYIGGKGFFTVDGGNSEIMLTRAGNFNLDPQGYLVTASGNRVYGTDTLYSSAGSTTPALIPPKLSLSTFGNPDEVAFASKRISEDSLNALSYKDGDFDVEISLSDGSTIISNIDITIGTTPDVNNNLTQVLNTINAQLNADIEAFDANPASGTGIVQARISEDSVGVGNGCIEFIVDPATDIDSGAGVVTVQGIQMVSKGSDFCDQTKLAQALPITDAGGNIIYKSKVLDYRAEVGPPDNVLSANDLSAFNISSDGSIDATYANGDKLTVETRDTTTNGFKYLVYQLPNGVEIKQEDITVNADVIEPANLQLQLASVINEKGLLSEGGNSFSTGPNSGELTFSVGSDNGFGVINNGGLESSNVDLPTQFAEMIVTQRAIEANSRSFDTVSQILQRIIQIGR